MKKMISQIALMGLLAMTTLAVSAGPARVNGHGWVSGSGAAQGSGVFRGQGTASGRVARSTLAPHPFITRGCAGS